MGVLGKMHALEAALAWFADSTGTDELERVIRGDADTDDTRQNLHVTFLLLAFLKFLKQQFHFYDQRQEEASKALHIPALLSETVARDLYTHYRQRLRFVVVQQNTSADLLDFIALAEEKERRDKEDDSDDDYDTSGDEDEEEQGEEEEEEDEGDDSPPASVAVWLATAFGCAVLLRPCAETMTVIATVVYPEPVGSTATESHTRPGVSLTKSVECPAGVFSLPSDCALREGSSMRSRGGGGGDNHPFSPSAIASLLESALDTQLKIVEDLKQSPSVYTPSFLIQLVQELVAAVNSYCLYGDGGDENNSSAVAVGPVDLRDTATETAVIKRMRPIHEVWAGGTADLSSPQTGATHPALSAGVAAAVLRASIAASVGLGCATAIIPTDDVGEDGVNCLAHQYTPGDMEHIFAAFGLYLLDRVADAVCASPAALPLLMQGKPSRHAASSYPPSSSRRSSPPPTSDEEEDDEEEEEKEEFDEKFLQRAQHGIARLLNLGLAALQVRLHEATAPPLPSLANTVATTHQKTPLAGLDLSSTSSFIGRVVVREDECVTTVLFIREIAAACAGDQVTPLRFHDRFGAIAKKIATSFRAYHPAPLPPPRLLEPAKASRMSLKDEVTTRRVDMRARNCLERLCNVFGGDGTASITPGSVGSAFFLPRGSAASASGSSASSRRLMIEHTLFDIASHVFRAEETEGGKKSTGGVTDRVEVRLDRGQLEFVAKLCAIYKRTLADCPRGAFLRSQFASHKKLCLTILSCLAYELLKVDFRTQRKHAMQNGGEQGQTITAFTTILQELDTHRTLIAESSVLFSPADLGGCFVSVDPAARRACASLLDNYLIHEAKKPLLFDCLEATAPSQNGESYRAFAIAVAQIDPECRAWKTAMLDEWEKEKQKKKEDIRAHKDRVSACERDVELRKTQYDAQVKRKEEAEAEEAAAGTHAYSFPRKNDDHLLPDRFSDETQQMQRDRAQAFRDFNHLQRKRKAASHDATNAWHVLLNQEEHLKTLKQQTAKGIVAPFPKDKEGQDLFSFLKAIPKAVQRMLAAARETDSFTRATNSLPSGSQHGGYGLGAPTLTQNWQPKHSHATLTLISADDFIVASEMKPPPQPVVNINLEFSESLYCRWHDGSNYVGPPLKHSVDLSHFIDTDEGIDARHRWAITPPGLRLVTSAGATASPGPTELTRDNWPYASRDTRPAGCSEESWVGLASVRGVRHLQISSVCEELVRNQTNLHGNDPGGIFTLRVLHQTVAHLTSWDPRVGMDAVSRLLRDASRRRCEAFLGRHLSVYGWLLSCLSAAAASPQDGSRPLSEATKEFKRDDLGFNTGSTELALRDQIADLCLTQFEELSADAENASQQDRADARGSQSMLCAGGLCCYAASRTMSRASAARYVALILGWHYSRTAAMTSKQDREKEHREKVLPLVEAACFESVVAAADCVAATDTNSQEDHILTRAMRRVLGRVLDVPKVITWRRASDVDFGFSGHSPTTGDTYDVDLLTGLLLCNGRKLCGLPAAIRQDTVFQRIFGPTADFETSMKDGHTFRTANMQQALRFPEPISFEFSLIINSQHKLCDTTSNSQNLSNSSAFSTRNPGISGAGGGLPHLETLLIPHSQQQLKTLRSNNSNINKRRRTSSSSRSRYRW